LQTTILMQMIRVVEVGFVVVPLWDTNTTQDPTMNNQKFLRENVVKLLTTAFGNLSPSQIRSFVLGLFELYVDPLAFKQHLRDFLVKLKEFSGADNEELFLEEKEAVLAAAREAEAKRIASIPGLLPVNEREFAMND